MEDKNSSPNNSIQELGSKKYIIKNIIDFFTRKKWLYKTIGVLAFASLITEISAIVLPNELIPNYNTIIHEYGYLSALGLAFFIGRNFNQIETNWVLLKLFILLICLWIDYRIQTDNGNRKTIWNFFIGINQNINQDYKDND